MREGGITRTAEKLLVGQSTVSGQLRELERVIGAKLYETSGRKITLTTTGRLVFEYADDIFSTGQELMDRLKGTGGPRSLPFVVGIPDVMPKLIASRILEPVLQLPEKVRLVCREAKLSELLIDLSHHRLDIVLSDSQVGSQNETRVFHHFLGESTVEWMAATPPEAAKDGEFSEFFSRQPFILPTEGTVLRRLVEQWFVEKQMAPTVVAEIEDSALMKSLASRNFE